MPLMPFVAYRRGRHRGRHRCSGLRRRRGCSRRHSQCWRSRRGQRLHHRLKRRVLLLSARNNVAMTAGVCGLFIFTANSFRNRCSCCYNQVANWHGTWTPPCQCRVSPSRLVVFGTGKAGGSSIPPAVLLFFPERDQPGQAVRTNVSSIASRSTTKRLALSSACGPAKRRAIVVSGEYASAGSSVTCIWPSGG